jgi:hypothetical protein
LICVLPIALLAQKKPTWRAQSRLQLSTEYDNNIRENPTDSLQISDQALRFLVQTRATRAAPGSNFNLSYHGGLQLYADHGFENKLVNEITASGSRKLGRFSAGVKLYGRLKLYLNDILDHSSGAGTVFVRLPPLRGFGNEFSLRYLGQDYRDFPLYGYRDRQIRWRINRRVRRNTAAVVSLILGGMAHDRPAISATEDASQITYLAGAQEDTYLQTEAELNYSRRCLVNLRYTFQYNHSNSFGYSYARHQLIVILGVSLPHRFWLRSYAALQVKNYSDASPPIFLTDIDPERDDSNFVILDLSKDLNRQLSALLRLALYDNESVIRDRFYKKALITAGFDFRF